MARCRAARARSRLGDGTDRRLETAEALRLKPLALETQLVVGHAVGMGEELEVVDRRSVEIVAELFRNLGRSNLV